LKESLLMKRFLLAPMLSLALLATQARADPLGDLIKFRTGWHGESCARHENSAVCTLGKSIPCQPVLNLIRSPS
jgi:hypothetical protein